MEEFTEARYRTVQKIASSGVELNSSILVQEQGG